MIGSSRGVQIRRCGSFVSRARPSSPRCGASCAGATSRSANANGEVGHGRGTAQRLAAALLLLLAAGAGSAAEARAQQPTSPPPSPREYLGYGPGERFTPTHRIAEYARLLASASSRLRYEVYGETPEGRPLLHLILSSQANLAAIDSIAAAHAALADPSTPAAEARRLAERLPAIVYLTYGIHGNEAASSEAALWTAWRLTEADGDLRAVLDSLVVVIDPVANPDGRERYVQWYRSVASDPPNPDPRSREHREPWPGGRNNHYLIDLNRDWAWATQAETRARLAAWRRWNPLVHVDFHEMSYESSYFFFPPADPIHPAYPPHVLAWAERFGAANAAAFDRRGWPYFTSDAYDLFYPGYGDSWPGLLGAVGMTYEQAGGGAAGRAVLREQGDTLTLADRVERHLEAGLETLRAAAAGRADLIAGFIETQRTVGNGAADYLLVPGADPSRMEALLDLLRTQGIAAERVQRPFRAAARPHPGFAPRDLFPAGSYLVRARQARGRLAETLLAPPRGPLQEGSYDIGAWSLPYAYGVEAHAAFGVPADALAPTPHEPAAQLPESAGGYGYLIAGGTASAPGMVRLLLGGVRARILSRPTRIDGRWWPPGSWFVPIAGDSAVHAKLKEAGILASAAPVASGRAEEGVDLGSAHLWPVDLPRIGVLTGDGVSPTSYGAHWHFLEVQLGMPFDALLLSDLAEVDLADYDVLVLPDQESRVLPAIQGAALRAWVEQGGRLVAVAGGAAAVAGMLDIPLRLPQVSGAGDGDQRLLRTRTERQVAERQDAVTGVILPVRVDSAHPLGWGWPAGAAGDGTFVLHAGTPVFEPVRAAEVIAYFPDPLEPAGGSISERNLRQLERGAWLITRPFGRGNVTLFADDPLFRLFWRQTHLPYLLALLVGPRR